MGCVFDLSSNIFVSRSWARVKGNVIEILHHKPLWASATFVHRLQMCVNSLGEICDSFDSWPRAMQRWKMCDNTSSGKRCIGDEDESDHGLAVLLSLATSAALMTLRGIIRREHIEVLTLTLVEASV